MTKTYYIPHARIGTTNVNDSLIYRIKDYLVNDFGLTVGTIASTRGVLAIENWNGRNVTFDSFYLSSAVYTAYNLYVTIDDTPLRESIYVLCEYKGSSGESSGMPTSSAFIGVVYMANANEDGTCKLIVTTPSGTGTNPYYMGTGAKITNAGFSMNTPSLINRVAEVNGTSLREVWKSSTASNKVALIPYLYQSNDITELTPGLTAKDAIGGIYQSIGYSFYLKIN